MNLSEAYKILDIPEGSDEETAKKAFKKLAVKYHPDVNKDPDAENNFKKVNEAFELIKSGKETNDPLQNNFSNDFFQGFDFDLSEILFGRKSKNKTKTHYAKDIYLEQTISFKESILGCQKEIKYTRNVACDKCHGCGESAVKNSCKTCNGTGFRVIRQNMTVIQTTCSYCNGNVKKEKCDICNGIGICKKDMSGTVKILEGTENNSVLNLGQIGDFNGYHYTNVFIKVKVEPQSGLSLKGNNVISYATVSLLDALQGTKITVPTIDGDKEVEIPSKIKNKETISLPNLGVGRKHAQIINVNVTYPSNINSLIDFLKNENNK